MSSFYVCPDWVSLGCTLALAALLVIQTVGLTFGFRRLQHNQLTRTENLLELMVLLQLLLQSRLIAEVRYYSDQGFVCPGGHILCRYVLFALLTALAAASAWQKRLFWPLSLPVAAGLTLPLTEELAGPAFSALFLATLMFWALRCTHLLLLRRREQNRGLSALSVKEAVDNLDSGLLFCQPDGQIMLQNSRMQGLMFALTGEMQPNGKLFYQRLLDGDVLPDCRKRGLKEQPAYWLADGTSWAFERHDLKLGRRACVLLVATATTEQWQTTRRLWEQNRELEQRNRELRQLLSHLDRVCRTEETLRAKSRVHDVLGQRISLLLRAMREHREPDEVLLQSFAEGLPRELTRASEGPPSLEPLVEAFRGLGVEIRVGGHLPDSEDLAAALFDIAAEAVTNAVRHGYASQVYLTLLCENGRWKMDITDSGIPVSGPVAEGGGLRGMRLRAERLGGTFSYEIRPGFHIHVELPEEEIP